MRFCAEPTQAAPSPDEREALDTMVSYEQTADGLGFTACIRGEIRYTPALALASLDAALTRLRERTPLSLFQRTAVQAILEAWDTIDTPNGADRYVDPKFVAELRRLAAGEPAPAAVTLEALRNLDDATARAFRNAIKARALPNVRLTDARVIAGLLADVLAARTETEADHRSGVRAEFRALPQVPGSTTEGFRN